MAENKKYRLVTRSDFDGLVCAVLLEHLDMINDILFVFCSFLTNNFYMLLTAFQFLPA